MSHISPEKDTIIGLGRTQYATNQVWPLLVRKNKNALIFKMLEDLSMLKPSVIKQGLKFLMVMLEEEICS